MIIDGIIEKIGESGPRSYYAFETFILNLLKHHTEKQNRPLYFNNNPKGTIAAGDAFAPKGIDTIEGPLMIEVKFDLLRSPRKHLIDLIHHRIETAKELDEAIPKFLVIFAKPGKSFYKEKIEEDIRAAMLETSVFLWGPEEINKVINQHRAKTKEIVDNLFALRLESAVSSSPSNWRAERDRVISKLKDQYLKGQFSLLLGAGVSSSAGMPDWNSLLNSLFVGYLTKELNGDGETTDADIAELVDRLNSINEPSALMAARYLRKGLVKSDAESIDFITAITTSLYKLRNTKFPIDSSLLKAISAMCTPRRTGAKIRSVITYNFDDLLERQLHSSKIHHHCIYTENETYDPDELPIYHVHGFLPEDKKNYSRLEKSTLVFSEEGYHQIYSDSYHWSNLVQLSTLRENNCLMIGLSMTDPNLRRLLDISARSIESSKHYTFMKRLTKNSFCHDLSQDPPKKIISNDLGANKFLERHHALNEEIMKELGVTIIWYEEYNEIPEILEEITRQ
ncbi:SIR2 family protein [Pseudomonas nitroreducens]|uniref:SIR2 family protein n=1 Tax=Pseudomonas nitroreducens TaxID=46680 RepID=UPI00209EBD83|nr:SIR2 family protein [Pseudomonas nitroreducens]MCP1625636.1 hypothetical protein [Pseudomonas nitroreducens]